MDRKKTLLYINSALYSLWAILMAGSAIRIYRDGAAYQAQGHPEAWIFTREKAMEAFGTFVPVLALAVVMTLICVIKGIRDDSQDKPVADPDLISIYKAERETERDVQAEAAKAKKLQVVKITLLIAAVIFVIAGIRNGSMEDTLIKAINICTECVGLG
jgi:hypothetical protein